MKSINFLPPTFKLRHIDFEKYSMLKTEDNTIIIQRVPNLNSEIFKDLAAGGLACRRGAKWKRKNYWRGGARSAPDATSDENIQIPLSARK